VGGAGARRYRGAEIRCYMRDPDGYLIEAGQSTGLLEGKLADKKGPRICRAEVLRRSVPCTARPRPAACPGFEPLRGAETRVERS